MSQEEIDQLQQEIPEWKRQAMVVSDQQEPEERKGIFKRFGEGVSDRVSKTEAAQKFYQSEDYKKIEKLRAEMNEFKANLKEEIDTTQNPLI